MDRETLLAEIVRFRREWFEYGWPDEDDLNEMNRHLKQLIWDAEETEDE